MEKFIEKNKETNANFSNIDFKCADVTKLNLESNRYIDYHNKSNKLHFFLVSECPDASAIFPLFAQIRIFVYW